jgi:hypothetical protein
MLGTIILIAATAFALGMAALAWLIVHASKKACFDLCEQCSRNPADCGGCDPRLTQLIIEGRANSGN